MATVPPMVAGLSRSLLNFASDGLPVSAPQSSILRHVSNGAVGRGQSVQGADQVAQVAVAPHPPEARLRLHQRARHPALNHLPTAPPLDPPRVTLNAAHQVLDDVRRAQSTFERPRQTEPLHRQRLLEALPDGRRRAGVVALQ